VLLTVSNYEACVRFTELLPLPGPSFVVGKTDSQFYCVGGRTGIGIHKTEKNYRGERLAQGASVCITTACGRASLRSVDEVYQFLLVRHQDHPLSGGGSEPRATIRCSSRIPT